jgi:hypothetical protein
MITVPHLSHDSFERAPSQVLTARAACFRQLTDAGCLGRDDARIAAEQLAYPIGLDSLRPDPREARACRPARPRRRPGPDGHGSRMSLPIGAYRASPSSQ